MNYIPHHGHRIAARNEGKIKSYESCVDVRAWSHDIRARDRYLRDWMKRDMPICILPVCTLAGLLTVMTCRNRGRVCSVVPKCHSTCKSKVLLDNICSSCHAMKDCLRTNKEFEKYFIEEDLETLHWPCERCLEILKSIKLFWKIILEKVLKIQIPRTNEFKGVGRSIHNVAKEWRKEIIQEAIFVKTTNSTLVNQNALNENYSDSTSRSDVHRDNSRILYVYQNKSTETDCVVRSIANQKNGKFLRKNASKCTSARIKMVNTEIETCNEKKCDELSTYENNIEHLQQQFILQKRELDRLEKENISLHIQLQNIRQKHSNNSFNLDHSLTSNDGTVALPRGPFKHYTKEKVNSNAPKDIDSEMIISLESGTNESYRHISMLQVLHKTNTNISNQKEGISCKNEDPVQILNKVQKTFGALVGREVSIANKTKESNNKDILIKTTFRNISLNHSMQSCSTSSYSVPSESNFESAKETNATSTISPVI